MHMACIYYQKKTINPGYALVYIRYNVVSILLVVVVLLGHKNFM